jgi:deoxyribonuclease-4
MPRLGAHMSIAGGVSRAIVRGHSIHCEAIQVFTKNQRRWAEPDIPPEEIAAFKELQAETGIHPIISHDSYLTNLASPDDDLWHRSVASLIRELKRCEALGIPYMNMHPGSHTGSGEETGLRRVAQGLDTVHRATPNCRVMTLLETTAGQGSDLGYTFEHLRDVMEMAATPERMGICLDTCHVFAAGYELRSAEGYGATFAELEALIGLEHLRAFHLNGSQGGLRSRLDRHAQISEGELGLAPFRMLLNDPRFADRPMVLETPKGKEMKEDILNLAILRDLLE